MTGHKTHAPGDANRREEAVAKYMLGAASGALGELAAALEDLDNDAGARGRVALSMAFLGASWNEAARVAHLPSPDAARMAAKRAAAGWRNDDVELSRTLLLMQGAAVYHAAMNEFQETRSAAFLRVAERAIGRQQALIPGLAVQRQEVVVRQGEPEASPYARPEYGPGRTWIDHVRDGLPFDQLHPDDVHRMRLTPRRCEELRAVWAREAELEHARTIEVR
ncbi:hypothetical protein Cch01nite_31770 [Cellulomonas chitinilytica]|uniref:Uncharacterized protein n=1 Tax=Cellulomonas chitinilytica TaxID=398759 RepID=A0A919P5R0_9CELL|nr:hypothetical protein [Cellulomonas chitinilytica]GIG22453.1 hypothetical protein Cch01nite_31770 [Cellulomonas chitinilytica]